MRWPGLELRRNAPNLRRLRRTRDVTLQDGSSSRLLHQPTPHHHRRWRPASTRSCSTHHGALHHWPRNDAALDDIAGAELSRHTLLLLDDGAQPSPSTCFIAEHSSRIWLRRRCRAGSVDGPECGGLLGRALLEYRRLVWWWRWWHIPTNKHLR